MRLRFSSYAEWKALMTQKTQKTKRKNDKKSIVNIRESGYNEEQIGTVEDRRQSGGRVHRKVGGSSGDSQKQ